MTVTPRPTIPANEHEALLRQAGEHRATTRHAFDQATEDLRDIVIDARAAGVPHKTIARIAGIALSTVQKWTDA